VQVPLRRTLDRIPALVDKLPPPAVHFLTDVVKLPCLTHRQQQNSQRSAQCSTAAVPTTPSRYSPRGLTVSQAMGTRQFWLLWTMIIACGTAGLNTAAIYKQFASTSAALTGDEFQALVGGIGALFNGIGRIFWGAVSDRIGFKTSFMLLSSLQALSMLVYTQAAQSKVSFSTFPYSLENI
jgi:cyanate permease